MATRAPASELARSNVVIIGDGQDEWLAGARSIVIGELVAHDEPSVEAAILALLTRHPEATAVELISHSDSNNLLKIGGWSMGPTAFANSSAELKARLQDKVLRLVGCATAVGAAATNALAGIRTNLRTNDVVGTRGIVGHLDLDGNGLRADLHGAILQPARQQLAPMAGELADDNVPRLGSARELSEDARRALLRGLSDRSVARVRDVLALVGPAGSYTFPGILSEPRSSAALDGEGGVAGRLDILFGGQLVRITRSRPPGGNREDRPATEYLFRVPPGQRQAIAARLTMA